MQMLVDLHYFTHCAAVPWPNLSNSQVDWINGVRTIESWLNDNIGHRLLNWAWDDSKNNCYIGVAFKWDQDRLLFVLAWS
jgi:hypothetical protein